ncbi:TPA: DUF6691 family protein [Morganella morganii]
MPVITALISGILFGLGLLVAGMGNPQKILAFLDITGNWDPSLLITMAVAMAVSMVAFTVAKKRKKTVCGTPVELPVNSKIDKRLLTGAVLFGLGWGLAGICPGPGIVLSGMLSIKGLVFTASMIAGMVIFALYSSYQRGKA